MNHFIELELAFGKNKKIEINSMYIESIKKTEDEKNSYTVIKTFSGNKYDVKETSKEIKKLMNSKKITYFNNPI
jgi:uncharacterized protein YlzI (FlbEa/FlbD family)